MKSTTRVLLWLVSLRILVSITSSNELNRNRYVLYNGKRFTRFGILLSMDESRHARMVCRGDIGVMDNFDNHVCYVLGYRRALVSDDM